LDFHVGWARYFSCPPTSLKKSPVCERAEYRQEAEQFIFQSVRKPEEQEEQVALHLDKMRQLNDDKEIFISNVTQECLENQNDNEINKRQN